MQPANGWETFFSNHKIYVVVNVKCIQTRINRQRKKFANIQIWMPVKIYLAKEHLSHA